MTTVPATARRISVGIGQIAVSSDAAEVLVAYGLGSCVGVSAYDPVAHVGGLEVRPRRGFSGGTTVEIGGWPVTAAIDAERAARGRRKVSRRPL